MKAKFLVFLLITSVFLFSLGTGVLAQETELPDPGLTPDSPFYFLERIAEGIGTFFTFGDLKKAERHTALATERLSEVEAMAEKEKPKVVEKALERYENQLEKALFRAEKAEIKGKNIEEVTKTIAEVTQKHLIVLEEVLEKVPEEARPAIERAMMVSGEGNERALEALKKVEERKITICHYPPDNPDARHTIEINESALEAHLAHGDTIGPCEDEPEPEPVPEPGLVPSEPEPPEEECSDSDGGLNSLNFYVKGSVTDSTGTHWDSCPNIHYIDEYYCGWNSAMNRYEAMHQVVLCPNNCQDGACLKAATKPITVIYPNGGEKWVVGNTYNIIWEADEGIDIVDIELRFYDSQKNLNPGPGPAGTVIYWGFASQPPSYPFSIPVDWKYKDYPYYKVEVLDHKNRFTTMDKSDDFFSIDLSDDSSLVFTECTDSDGGKDYFVRGKSTVRSPILGFLEGWDACVENPTHRMRTDSSPYLVELWCGSLTRRYSEVYTCPNGCYLGACIRGDR